MDEEEKEPNPFTDVKDRAGKFNPVAPRLYPMERRGYRFRTAGAAGGGQPAESGVRVVQLPGCIAMGRLGVAGNKKALADVECVGTADYRGGGGARPFASAVLQVESLRPAAAGPPPRLPQMPRAGAAGGLWAPSGLTQTGPLCRRCRSGLSAARRGRERGGREC